MKRVVKKVMKKPARGLVVLERLAQEYPDVTCALFFETPFQLLVATILSAQCTDVRVNKVTPGLFAVLPDAAAFSRASVASIARRISSVNFFRNKAKHIALAARMIMEEFGGEVPRTMEQLVRLPGVARKTANVVLGVGFGVQEGVVVDTHVRRLSQRLGLTRENDPVKIERDLVKIVPQKMWETFSLLLISHGRKICVARKPLCEHCVLRSVCPSAFTFDRRVNGKKVS